MRRRPSRRQAFALVAATGTVLALALVATTSGGPAAGATAGPTAKAEARDLKVTDAERGTLARADTTTVLYDGTGGSANGGPAGSNVQAQSAGQATPADVTDPPTTSSTTMPEPTTTAPTNVAPPLDPPVDEAPAVEEPPAPPEADQPADQGPVQGGPVDESASDGADGANGSGGPSGPARATLTELLAVGETATRGTVLYRADDEPIVALLSSTPLFRDLRVGVTDGPDVQAVESELRALGYSGFTVDDHYDAGTAAAVRRWETELGRAEPDGVVTVGEVRLLAEPTAVLEHGAEVGDLLEPDDAVLVLGAESRVLEADVEAAEVGSWAVGTPVELTWSDGSTTSGSVVEVGRDVADSQVPIVVALAAGTGTEAPIGSRVGIVRTVAERTGAVAVPVSAVLQGEGGPAVRVAGNGRDRLVPVELGIVDDGWVEVTEGLEVGTSVRLPG
jgi:hypothetical protein